MVDKIAFGGGCHWCTEAVFQSLKGVTKVNQGFVSSTAGENESYSESVVIYFNVEEITLEVLIEIHLLTHKSTSEHSMRKKYRSAVYFFNKEQQQKVIKIIDGLQKEFDKRIITKVLEFKSFKSSEEQFLNYYYSNPEKPFCERFINPKLELLTQQFSKYTDKQKIKSKNYEPH